jgi:tetratricopeptide (TPR) repeat protein
MCFLSACGESDSTKKHRFLLKGNAALADQNYQAAIQYFNEALKIDSCFADAHNNIGTALFRQKEYAEALEFYNRALACNPKFHDAYLNRANTLYELNRLPDALRDVEKLVSVRPDTLPALFLQGLIFTKTRDYQQAQKSFLRVLLKDSLNVEVYINLGTLSYYRKQYPEAIQYLERAISINPEESNAHNTRALIESAKGDLDAALQSVNKALSLKPGDAYYRNNRGYVYLLQHELPLALEDINFSITTDPYNGWAYRNKGIYYLKTNDALSAIRMFLQAIELEPFVEKGYFFLAQAYVLVGDESNACNALRESVSRGEESSIPELKCE